MTVPERGLGLDFLTIRIGHNFADLEGVESGGIPFLANPEGSYFSETAGVRFCQSRRVIFFFANLEGSSFCQSGSVLFLPMRRGHIFLPNRNGAHVFFANPEGS